jgi:hypothetical protein
MTTAFPREPTTPMATAFPKMATTVLLSESIVSMATTLLMGGIQGCSLQGRLSAR